MTLYELLRGYVPKIGLNPDARGFRVTVGVLQGDYNRSHKGNLTGMDLPRVSVFNVSKQKSLGDRVEVAETSASRLKGLLGRDGLAKGEGLWIVPTEGVHTFRMRFPIDLVFLNKKKRVTKVVPRLKPSRMAISWRAKSVIELPAGVIEVTGTEAGDEIEIRRLE